MAHVLTRDQNDTTDASSQIRMKLVDDHKMLELHAAAAEARVKSERREVGRGRWLFYFA